MNLVEKKFSSIEKLSWKPVSYFEGEGFRSCVDGREPNAIVGNPGGDAGDFVLLLATVENVTGQALNQKQIAEIFDDFLKRFGSFYLHTDTHAVTNLVSRVQSDSNLKVDLQGLEIQADGKWISTVPESAQKNVLQLLTDPSHVGCGHLRLMLQQSDVYGVRKELVENVIRCFFNVLWAGDERMHFVVLEGSHAEQAVCSISDASVLSADSRIPLVSPLENGDQVFVHHGDVAQYFRGAAVKWMAEQFPKILVNEDTQKVAEEIHVLGQTQLGATLERLAMGLPVVGCQLSENASPVLK